MKLATNGMAMTPTLMRLAAVTIAVAPGALAAGALAVTLAAGTAHAAFNEIVIDTGFLVEHPLLHSRFDAPDNRFVVIAGRDEDHAQRLAVYRLDVNGDVQPKPAVSLSPGPDLIAYDVGRLGDRDVLVFISPGSIRRFDPERDEAVELITMSSLYGQQRAGELTALDFFRDLNDDGLDDLLVPDLAGHRVRLQLEGGGFGDEVVLGQSVAMSLDEAGARFEPRQLYIGDSNFDGLSDIVTWRGGAFHIYEQQSGSRFGGTPQVLPLSLDLPTEAQLRALDSDRGAVDQSKLTTQRIWTVSDFNSDGVPDVLTEARLSEGVFDKRNEFRMHLGRRNGSALTYRAEEDALLDSKGLQFGLVETDIDGDGKKDLIVRKVRLNLGRVIGALLSGSVSLQIQFFRMTDDDRFDDRANFETRTKVKFSMSSGQIDIPAVRVADFDGDDLQDLALETRKGQLAVYQGEATDRLFSDDAVTLDVPMPRNGELVQADDINGDGRADIVVRYTVADGDEAARTVRLLLSTASTD